jgi:pentatricopeptide repeat domain-containing protein 1
LELLEEMRTSGCTPNVVSYNGVLSALSLQGRSEEALSLFEELKDDNLKPIRLTFQVRIVSSSRVVISADTHSVVFLLFIAVCM